jgi:hypothetical protein
MGNVYKPVEGSRLTVEYAEARMLFEERRQAQARVAEINRALRELSEAEPDAVQAARSEIPFRKPHGRPKSGKKVVPASASGALSWLSMVRLSEL